MGRCEEKLVHGDYYSLDEDDCDEAIYGMYEVDNYVAVLIGCGEHTTPEMWILKSENKVGGESIWDEDESD